MPATALLRLAVPLILVAAGLASAADAAPKGQSLTLSESPGAAETAALKRALGPDYDAMAPFNLAHGDLNGDGRPDLIVRSDSAGWCGSLGCATLALLATAQGYSTDVIRLATAFGPVEILPGVDHGMHRLRFSDGDHIFHWSGTAYR